MKIKCLLLVMLIVLSVLPSCKKDVPSGGGHAYHEQYVNV